MKIHVLLRHLAMAVLLLLPAFAFAQKVTVRGVVVDETFMELELTPKHDAARKGKEYSNV